MTQIEYLNKKYAETTPAWLKSYSKGQPLPLAEFLHSRIVYYPGSAWDWHPLEVFGGSRSAHCFIYADYLQPEDEVIGHLQGEYGLGGYHILDSIRISESALRRVAPWRRHFLTPEEQRRAAEGTREFRRRDAPDSYARLVVLERDPSQSDGADRLAILFLGADGHATFEAIFANGNAPDLFGFLLQEHGWGGNYDRWGRDGLCDKIMQRAQVFPKVVFSEREDWLYDGYQMINGLTPSGSRNRDLYERATGAGVCEIALNPSDPNEFKRILLETHRANRVRVYADGRRETGVWRADAFTENSNLMGNIKTSSAYRHASADGVVRLEFNFEGIFPPGS